MIYSGIVWDPGRFAVLLRGGDVIVGRLVLGAYFLYLFDEGLGGIIKLYRLKIR